MGWAMATASNDFARSRHSIKLRGCTRLVGAVAFGECWSRATIRSAPGIRKRSQQRRVDEGEDGCVGADPEREGQRGDGCKSGTLAQGSQGIAKVLRETLEDGPAPDGASVFFQHSHVPENPPRGVTRFFRRKAGLLLLLGFGLEMGAQFTIEVLLAPPPSHLNPPRAGACSAASRHSYLKASIGSIVAARLAGKYAARNAAISITIETAHNVRGSWGATP